MGNLNISLDGYAGRIVDLMVREGFVKTKTEALRLALFEFDRIHKVLPDEDTAFGLFAQSVLDRVAAGKEKVSKFSWKDLE